MAFFFSLIAVAIELTRILMIFLEFFIADDARLFIRVRSLGGSFQLEERII